MTRGGGSGPNIKLILGAAVVILFIIFLVLPNIFSVAAFLQNPSREQFVEVFAGLVTPWWVEIAAASAIIFVLLVIGLRVIGAEDIL